jgi:hypothetical protein
MSLSYTVDSRPNMLGLDYVSARSIVQKTGPGAGNVIVQPTLGERGWTRNAKYLDAVPKKACRHTRRL